MAMAIMENWSCGKWKGGHAEGKKGERKGKILEWQSAKCELIVEVGELSKFHAGGNIRLYIYSLRR